MTELDKRRRNINEALSELQPTNTEGPRFSSMRFLRIFVTIYAGNAIYLAIQTAIHDKKSLPVSVAGYVLAILLVWFVYYARMQNNQKGEPGNPTKIKWNGRKAGK